MLFSSRSRRDSECRMRPCIESCAPGSGGSEPPPVPSFFGSLRSAIPALPYGPKSQNLS